MSERTSVRGRSGCAACRSERGRAHAYLRAVFAYTNILSSSTFSHFVRAVNVLYALLVVLPRILRYSMKFLIQNRDQSIDVMEGYRKAVERTCARYTERRQSVSDRRDGRRSCDSKLYRLEFV